MDKLFLAVFMIVLLLGCQTNEGLFDTGNNTPMTSIPIQVKSVVEKGTNTDNFKVGDDVWLWADKHETTDGYIKAWHLTAGDDNGNFNGSTHYWPADGSSLDVNAIHGNFDEEIVENDTEMLSQFNHTVSSLQGDETEIRKSDLLFAKKINATHNNDIGLEFDHLLSKIVVRLLPSETDNDAVGITVDELEDASVQIFNIMSKTALSVSSEKLSTVGETSNIDMGQVNNANKEAVVIIPPQSIAKNQLLFSVKLADKNRVEKRLFNFYSSASYSFEGGKLYKFNISLKNYIRIVPGEVIDWNNESKSMEWNVLLSVPQVVEWRSERKELIIPKQL